MGLSRLLPLVAIASALCTRCVKESVRERGGEVVKSMEVAVQYSVIVDYGVHAHPGCALVN